MTECNSQIDLFSIRRRSVTATLTGERVTSNTGLLLLARIEQETGICRRFSSVLHDRRDSRHVQHGLEQLVRQRVLQIAAGYEDANDATFLRNDPALQAAVGYVPGLEDSILASQPTLSRFEDRSPRELARILRVSIEMWIDHLIRTNKRRISLEFDTTDAVTHGEQQLSMFHGYYERTIYHPLLVFDDDGYPIVALLRPGNAHGGRGSLSILRLIVKLLRRRLPHLRVSLRADAGFATPAMYATCERLGLSYHIAQTVHDKYKKMTAAMVELGQQLAEASGESIVLYDEFTYKAQAWNRARRVIAKAECSAAGSHVRYVVTNVESGTPEEGYKTYSGRGQSENYIKDLKNAMFADRLSCMRFWPNQFRLFLHTVAYTIMHLLRHKLHGTELAHMQLDTLRLRLIKIGASFVVTARRIWVKLSSSDPASTLFNSVAMRLTAPPG